MCTTLIEALHSILHRRELQSPWMFVVGIPGRVIFFILACRSLSGSVWLCLSFPLVVSFAPCWREQVGLGSWFLRSFIALTYLCGVLASHCSARGTRTFASADLLGSGPFLLSLPLPLPPLPSDVSCGGGVYALFTFQFGVICWVLVGCNVHRCFS